MLDHAALVLIEFQREWLDATGGMQPYIQDRVQFDAAVSHAVRVLQAARDAHLPVIHVGYDFEAGHPELGRVRYGLREILRTSGLFSGEGSQFAPDFAPRAGEFVARGRIGVSAFAGSNLDGFLRNNRIERLYLSGFALQTCVESTLRDAHDRGYEAVVVEDATAAFTPEQREYVLDRVVPIFGARVSAAALVAALKQASRPV